MSELQLNLSNTNGVQTLSSLEVVKLINQERLTEYKTYGGKYTELQHRDFTRKVPEVFGEEGCAKFSAYLKNEQNGQEYRCFQLPQREACLMLMSYSYKLQAKVYDAWVAAEKKLEVASYKVPTSFKEALRLALEQQEQIEQQALLIEQKQEIIVDQQDLLKEQQPKVEMYKAFMDADGLLTMKTAGDLLGIGRVKLYALLRREKYITSDNAAYTRYSCNLGGTGLFKSKIGRFWNPRTEQYEDALRATTMMTPKGLEYFGNRFGLTINTSITPSK